MNANYQIDNFESTVGKQFNFSNNISLGLTYNLNAGNLLGAFAQFVDSGFKKFLTANWNRSRVLQPIDPILQCSIGIINAARNSA